jgi:hypothetical protein
MSAAPRRCFTLLDAMVLVAATAVGLTLARPLSDEPFPLHHLKEGLLPGLAPLTRHVILGWSLVVTWTLALLVMGWGRSRLLKRRRFATPGFAACVVAVSMLGLEVAFAASYWAIRGWMGPSPRVNDYLALLRSLKHGAFIAPSIGFAVAAWWMTMALSSRWRPARDWLDRSGRVVGALWIALGFLMFHLRTNANINYR